MNRDKVLDFLEELTELTKKYKIAISGLGEDSPFLFYPMYCGKDDSYRVDRDGNNLVWSGDTVEDRSEFKVIRKGKKTLKLPKKLAKEIESKQAANQ